MARATSIDSSATSMTRSGTRAASSVAAWIAAVRAASDKVPLELVANSERTFPAEWIAPGGLDVTDEFVRYARPLIGDDMVTLPLVDGRQRLTRFEPIYADKKLPDYVPQADRKK